MQDSARCLCERTRCSRGFGAVHQLCQALIWNVCRTLQTACWCHHSLGLVSTSFHSPTFGYGIYDFAIPKSMLLATIEGIPLTSHLEQLPLSHRIDAHLLKCKWWIEICRNANEVAIELITEHIRSKLKQPDLRWSFRLVSFIPTASNCRWLFVKSLSFGSWLRSIFLPGVCAINCCRIVRFFHCAQKFFDRDLLKCRRVYCNLEVMPSNYQVGLLLEGLQMSCMILAVGFYHPQSFSLTNIALQIRGMHTIIRDEKTSADNFVFYTDRLLRLVSSRKEKALGSKTWCSRLTLKQSLSQYEFSWQLSQVDCEIAA